MRNVSLSGLVAVVVHLDHRNRVRDADCLGASPTFALLEQVLQLANAGLLLALLLAGGVVSAVLAQVGLRGGRRFSAAMTERFAISWSSPALSRSCDSWAEPGDLSIRGHLVALLVLSFPRSRAA